jgi:hypothetical protein
MLANARLLAWLTVLHWHAAPFRGLFSLDDDDHHHHHHHHHDNDNADGGGRRGSSSHPICGSSSAWHVYNKRSVSISTSMTCMQSRPRLAAA